MKTIRVKSSDPESQGPFVVINEEDFDAAKHELFDVEESPTEKAPRKPKHAKSEA